MLTCSRLKSLLTIDSSKRVYVVITSRRHAKDILDIVHADSDTSEGLLLASTEVMLANLDRGTAALRNIYGLSTPVFTLAAGQIINSFQAMWFNVTDQPFCGKPMFTGSIIHSCTNPSGLTGNLRRLRSKLTHQQVSLWRKIEALSFSTRGKNRRVA